MFDFTFCGKSKLLHFEEKGEKKYNQCLLDMD